MSERTVKIEILEGNPHKNAETAENAEYIAIQPPTGDKI